MQIHADPVPHPCMIQIFLAFGLDFEKSVVIFSSSFETSLAIGLVFTHTSGYWSSFLHTPLAIGLVFTHTSGYWSSFYTHLWLLV